MISYWSEVGSWYVVAQYICFVIIVAGVITVAKDFVAKKFRRQY